MRLTKFGKAIGKGKGQEAEADFLKECVWAEADFASHCTEVCTIQGVVNDAVPQGYIPCKFSFLSLLW